MEQELLEKKKWINRLEAIAAVAGVYARFNDPEADDDVLSPEERNKLKKLVLAVGAFRTISFHVRPFERFLGWARSQWLQVYPLSQDLVTKYALDLDGRQCGPTVIPSARAAISWVCSRLSIDPPCLDSLDIKAIELKVVEACAKEVKEAVPLPIELVLFLDSCFIAQWRIIQ